MCGIAGFWGAPKAAQELVKVVQRMIDTLVYRGPDGSGIWVDPESGLGLGHRRLAIVDLTDDGAQPMLSHCGRYVIVFNGEVYNYLELRQHLEGVGESFKGHSDTEVVLSAIVRWGIFDALRKFNGMFAFALWDRDERVLYLARDRLGKKPLYYGYAGGKVLFGSELKALHAAGDWQATPDLAAASSYFRYGFVPGDQSILVGIRRLPPGHLLRLPASDAALAEPEAYWSFADAARTALANPYLGSIEDAEAELEALLSDAVCIRRRADVPLGAFLSGGIDSSLVVALMQAGSGLPTQTFSVGFSEGAYDESGDAERVASLLGCRHRSVVLGPSKLPEIAQMLPMVYDEPFADVSQIPTMLVSQLAKESVTVCLSGDGGDEMFGGYHRHFLAERYWPRLSSVPLATRRFLGRQVRTGIVRRLATGFGFGFRNPESKLFKAAAALEAANLNELYVRLLAQGDVKVIVDSGLMPPLRELPELGETIGAGRKVMALDILNYLPDDILVKADRASMATSLELRCPMLDYRLIDFSWRLPISWLIGQNKGKLILRRLLERYLPVSAFDRPKMGFAVPIGEWLRGPLRVWAEAWLLGNRDDIGPKQEDIMYIWKRHQENQDDHGHWLWRVLVWRMWQSHWGQR
jgi:asparagine synthase (glutamine-hydrolysing)